MYLYITYSWRSFVALWRSWAVVLPRPIRRLLLTFFLFFVIFYMSGPVISLFNHIVDFHFPGFTIPTKRDLSKLPVIKDQVTFIRRVIEPAAVKNDGSFMLILICSGAAGEDHVQKRMAIRRTWGKISGNTNLWRVVFFLGTTHMPSVDSWRLNEAKKFGDMLIGDFPDTYRNITKKLMMAFKWASKQKYEYLLKTDDDVYINVPSLIQWIISHKDMSTSPLYAGVLYRANVNRDIKHRHYISWHDLPEKRYPWYPKGALYVLSGDIVKQIVKLSSKVKQVTVDDAYVGIMASYLGVQAIQLPGFIQWSFTPELLEYFDKCTYMNIFGMADNLSPKNMYFVHQQVLFFRNSSKWMCIHVNHPILLTGIIVICWILIWLYFHKKYLGTN